MKTKKILSLLVAMTMLLSCVGITAMAEDGDVTSSVVATEIKENDLTYAVRFDGKELLDDYNTTDWWMDVELTVNKNVTLDSTNDEADGYLSVLLPSLSAYGNEAGWRNLPAGLFGNYFTDGRTLEAGKPFRVLNYYWEDFSGAGKTQHYNQLFGDQAGLSCGVYFTDDFLAKNKDLYGEIALVIYQIEKGNEVKHTTLASYTFGEKPDDEASADVAEVNGVGYATLEEAAKAAKAGDTITMLADSTVTEDITLPAGITFNGNGFTVSGGIIADGDITFAGITKAKNFDVNYTGTTITIGEGACLELTGTGRMVIGHNCTFNITGTITDAKTANVADITPSLIMPGASFTGAGVTFNVTNAYIKTTASYCSSSKSASGTFDFNIENSIWEQFGKLAFEAQSTAATVNFDLKDSVLTTTSHLVFGVSKGEIVIDNSNVNVGKSNQIENQSTMTIKNGSVVNGAVATSSNAINPGTLIVENATYAVTGQFSGAGVGTGTLIIKKGANVSVGSIVDKANIVIDATGMTAGETIDFTANLSKFVGTVEVINNDALGAKIEDGKIVLIEKPVAKIGDATYATLEEALTAAEASDANEITVELLSDISLTGSPLSAYFKKYHFITNVEGGVTVSFAHNNWVDFANGSIGENVTFKADYFLLSGRSLVVKGNIETGYLYTCWGASTTIADTAIVNVRTGDATVQVKNNNTVMTVNGTLNCGVLNVWDGTAKLIVSGSNAKVDTYWFDCWDGTPSALVENGATMIVDHVDGLTETMSVSRGGTFAVDNATLKTHTLKLGHDGTAGVMTITGNSTFEGSIKLTTEASKVTGPAGLNVTTTLEGREVSYSNGVYGIKDDAVGLSGSGTAEDPYKLGTKEELFFFAEKVNDGTYKGVYAELTADIDLEQDDWTSIGTSANPFTGTFDGKGFKISNLWSYERGLFGYTSTGNYIDSGLNGRATIKNLVLEGAEVYNQSTSAVGALIGQAGQNTELSDVTVTGYIQVYGYGYVGGIVGQGYVHIDDCHVIGVNDEYDDISEINAAYWAVGGIVGHAGSEGGSSITNCSVENVKIYSTYYGAGSIAGVGTKGKIENVSAKNVNIEAQSSPGSNGYLVGCNYEKITGNSTATNVKLEVGGAEYAGADMVAKVGDTSYVTLEEALKALTSGATLTLLSDVTIDYAWDERNTGARIEVPATIDGNGKTITFACDIADGGNYHSAFRVHEDVEVEFKNLTIDMSSATNSKDTNRIRAISSVGSLTVDGCKFIGNSSLTNTRAIIFGEGSQHNAEAEITITGSTFTNWRKGVTDNENAKDMGTVTVTGNTFTNAGVALSASEAVTFTGNTVTNGYVSITSYTDSENLVVTATENTLTSNVDVKNMNYIDVEAENVTAQKEFFILPIELPTATVTEIEKEDLTFALNFKADEATEAQLAYYGDWFADYVLTVNKDVTFNADSETSDGYLSGQYDAWNENWVNVPFEDVTLKAGEPIKIMEYAAYLMGQSGLKLTYNDVYGFVKDFNCGVFFEEEFLAANPDFEVTLELRMYNPKDESESYTIGETYKFEASEAATPVAEVNGVGYSTLQAALDAAAAGTGNVTVEILDNINLAGVDWNPVTVSAPGYPVVTVNGNGKTITGLNDMLFAGTWAGGSGLIINDLTIADSNIVNDENDTKGKVGVGAFIGYPQASATITLNNCHLVNSTVKGGHWTGGLIGIAGGYSGDDGPVFMNLTIENCSVTGSTITGKGSAGGISGHAANDAWTNVVITDTTVSGNTITSTGSSNNKAGAVMGTIGAAGQSATANGNTKTGGVSVSATVSGNTVTSNGTPITTIYGRQGSTTGMLYVTGGTYDNNPIEENVAYAQPAEGYEIVQNEDKTWGVQEKAPEVKKFKLALTNATLGNSLAINFFYAKSDIVGTDYVAKIKHTTATGVEEKEIPYTDWVGNGDYIYVPYDGISAKQMGDIVEITICKIDGTAVSETETESLENYAINYFDYYKDDSSMKLWKKAIADMLNYGAAAQTYFGYNADKLVNVAAAVDVAEHESKEVTYAGEYKSYGEGAYATSLNLKDKIELIALFTGVTDGMTAKVEFTNHKKETISYEAELKKNGPYHEVIVDKLVIADINQPVKVTVYNADGSEYAWIQDSINEYLGYIQTTKDANPLFEMASKFATSAYAAMHAKD